MSVIFQPSKLVLAPRVWPGKFGVLYCDPPWHYDDKGCEGAAEKHYSTMRLEELARLDVLAHAAESCFMFMWATWPCLPDALSLINSWGFTYKTIAFVWVKYNRRGYTQFTGTGHYTRANTEPCLLAIREGGSNLTKDHMVHQIVESFETEEILRAPVGVHSAKPLAARMKIDRLVGPGVPRMEMFCRGAAPHWDRGACDEIAPTIQISQKAA